jgi:hypothetical protein
MHARIQRAFPMSIEACHTFVENGNETYGNVSLGFRQEIIQHRPVVIEGSVENVDERMERNEAK